MSYRNVTSFYLLIHLVKHSSFLNKKIPVINLF